VIILYLFIKIINLFLQILIYINKFGISFMEADLINNVINIQKVIRGFLIRRKVFKKKK
jgi:hypothetical protein